MIRISNIKLELNQSEEILKEKTAKILKAAHFKTFSIAKKSIDARDKSNVFYVYSVDVELAREEKYVNRKNVKRVEPYEYSVGKHQEAVLCRPVIVGSGPAGLFAGLVLAQAGLKPIILERGKDVENRKKDVNLFWEKGIFNPESNVQFGEGGAGTFSYGKLTTGIKDLRIHKVIDEFIQAGAPEEIRYLAKPHVGTDKLLYVVKNIREKIKALGGVFRFESKFTGFQLGSENGDECLTSIEYDNGQTCRIPAERVILALGHSARDTVEMLYEHQLAMESKAFSVGVRIEHSQKQINNIQYGKYAALLGAADYKINTRLANGRGVYTFCMCPGGVVVGAASEANRVVTNGMSYYSRDLSNANSAVLVSVSPQDYPSADPLGGIAFQRALEEKAFQLGGGDYKAPAQLVGDFLKGRRTIEFRSVTPTYKPGVAACDLRECFDDYLTECLKEGLIGLNKKLKGFTHDDAVMTAVESRSSSPVILKRDSLYQSNIKGIYTCGEGAGYAGGIISAAVDGIRCAEAVLQSYTL